ncbi:Uncharacterised protein g10096 [Pycnogonum litorale]
MYLYFTNRMTQPRVPIWKCSLTQARELRAESWQRNDICGVDYPAMSEFIVVNPARGGVCESCLTHDNDYINIIPTSKLTKSYALSNVGDVFPYLGSYTKDKLDASLKHVKTSEIPSNMHSLFEILKLIKWVVPEDSELAVAIQDIFQKQSNIDPGNIVNKITTGLGNIDHRFQTIEGLNGGFTNISTTALTHLTLDSNTAESFGRGSQDYNVYFQEIFSSSLGIVLSKLSNTESYISYHTHFNCLDCIVELPSDNFTTPEIYQPDWVPNMGGNPYSFVSQESVQVKVIPTIRLPYKKILPESTDQDLSIDCMLRAGIDLIRSASEDRDQDNPTARKKSSSYYSTLLQCHPVILLKGCGIQLIGWTILKFFKWNPLTAEVSSSRLLTELVKYMNGAGKNLGILMDKLMIHPKIRHQLYQRGMISGPPQNIPATILEIRNSINEAILFVCERLLYPDTSKSCFIHTG